MNLCEETAHKMGAWFRWPSHRGDFNLVKVNPDELMPSQRGIKDVCDPRYLEEL